MAASSFVGDGQVRLVRGVLSVECYTPLVEAAVYEEAGVRIMAAPVFSIVIPVYNVAPYLRECLDSVAKAAEQVENAGEGGQWRVEIICVDDGSTDGSAEILDEYLRREEKRGGQWKVIHQSNRGEGGARNAALEVATGEWIGFLDGDDLFTSEMLSAGLKLIRENPDCDIVRVRAAVFNHGDDPRQAKPFNCGLLSGVFCTGFYRRAKFGGVRFRNFIVGEDRVYAATCLFQSGRVAECSTIGYLYRQRATSISHTAMTARKAQDGFLHVAEMLKLAAENGRTLDPGFKRVLVAQVLEEGATNIRRIPSSERTHVRRCWLACVEELRKDGLLTKWGSFIAVVLRLLPCIPVIWFFCVLPRRLKRLGFHR